VKRRGAHPSVGVHRSDSGRGWNRLTWCGGAEDGTLTYTLTRNLDGLHVDRARIQSDGKRNSQSLLFVDASSFCTWCDSDDMRHRYVRLCTAVRSKGLELFDQHPASTDVQGSLRFG
jgi:hypothetical protein